MLENKDKIVNILQKGGVIAYVTDTVWGLGCLPDNESAVKKIYEIKKREAQKPLILMSNETYNLLDYVKPIPKIGQILIKKYFPGALTIVTDKSDKTPDYITSGMPTVGIRVPDNEIFREICEIAPGHVLATTSANLSHQPSAKTYEQALAMARSEGAELFTDETTPNINSPEFTKAVQTLKDIVDMGGCSEEGEDNLQLFMAGEVIFCPDGVWDRTALNEIEGLNWSSTNSICYNTTDPIYNYANSNQFVMLKNEERSDEKEKVIADFIDYVRENTLAWAGSGQVPASNAADDDPEFQELDQYFFVSTPEMEASVQFKDYKYAGYADDAINEVFGDILFGHIDLEEGLAQAQQQAEDNIAQNAE